LRVYDIYLELIDLSIEDSGVFGAGIGFFCGLERVNGAVKDYYFSENTAADTLPSTSEMI
jgi:hypothetical protein